MQRIAVSSRDTKIFLLYLHKCDFEYKCHSTNRSIGYIIHRNSIVSIIYFNLIR